MPAPALKFRLFLSSPSDVPQERNDAQAVVDEINASGEFKDLFTLIELYRWDDPAGDVPPSGRQNPQETVNKYTILPAECDLVVVIFYMRLGTPTFIDGRGYASGTDYEYTNALESDKPEIFLYRCTGYITPEMLDPAFDAKIEQFRKLNQYIEIIKQKSLVREYPNHADFKAIFKAHLLKHLRYLRTKTPDADNKPVKPPKPLIAVPYKGLRALQTGDVDIFFGRTSESLDVLARVEAKRFVPILGASGSGKSSLVMAGVLPKLAERGWRIIQCVPNKHPFDELAMALISQIPEFEIPKTRYIPEAEGLAQILREKPDNLMKQLRAVMQTQKIAVYIDQFEELFTISDPDQVKPFIEMIRQEANDITTIITMRADFYETALGYVDELQQDTYGLKKPSAFALYEMITRPAHDAGYMLDDRLAETIITQLGDDSGALALMAYLMETLYLRAKGRNDKHITYADYEALGGVEKAMNTLAEKAYADLPFEHKEAVLRNVFFHLIALTPDENGQLVPTRGRYPLDNFKPNSPERILIDRFADARLLVKDDKMVEVAHEAILRHWEQLVGWIDQNKGSMALYRQFERDANVWAENPESTPLTQHESQKYFYKALETLGLIWDSLPEPLKSYTEPEATRILRELDDIKTPHRRRYDIGERLARIGDPRPHIGVLPNGIPDIGWCLVDVPQDSQIRITDSDQENYTFTIKPFYVAKYLTTYAQYEAFVNADDGYNNPEWWKLFPEEYRPQDLRSAVNGNANAPRDTISWYQSMAYAHWLDATYRQNGLFEAVLGLNANEWKLSLPPEWVWQWMAQNGDEAREYPWGAWDEHPRANTTEASINDKSTAVGMYPHGKSACGAVDVAGNLWEWCLNDYGNISELNGYSNAERKVLRGGSFNILRDLARSVYRSRYDPYDGYNRYGFRVFVVPTRL